MPYENILGASYRERRIVVFHARFRGKYFERVERKSSYQTCCSRSHFASYEILKYSSYHVSKTYCLSDTASLRILRNLPTLWKVPNSSWCVWNAFRNFINRKCRLINGCWITALSGSGKMNLDNHQPQRVRQIICRWAFSYQTFFILSPVLCVAQILWPLIYFRTKSSMCTQL